MDTKKNNNIKKYSWAYLYFTFEQKSINKWPLKLTLKSNKICTFEIVAI